MRTFPLAALVAGAVLAASSCGSLGLIAGNGVVQKESRSVASFSSITVQGSGTLRVHKGNRYVAVTSDSNILPYVTTTVSGSELIIGFRGLASIGGATRLEYDVTVPQLAAISLEGSCDCIVDSLSGSTFKGSISGSGSIDAGLNYDSVEIASSGSGGATLSGSATKVSLGTSGSGSIDAESLSARRASVRIYGSGSVDLRASSSVDATIYGSGSVFYYGSPSVSSVISGSGRVVKAGD